MDLVHIVYLLNVLHLLYLLYLRYLQEWLIAGEATPTGNAIYRRISPGQVGKAPLSDKQPSLPLLQVGKAPLPDKPSPFSQVRKAPLPSKATSPAPLLQAYLLGLSEHAAGALPAQAYLLPTTDY